ncbi:MULTISPECIES: DUF5983 family protein [Bacillus]|uniref:DUF5983 family protein n=1 Tax=Bacillus TaxID=1386 RepID=UPI0002DCFB91|nr:MULTISPECIES: hypothetical protein [Bacillus]
MIENILSLSTAHITKETETWLIKQALLSAEGKMDVSVFEKVGDGWFIPVNERVFTEEIKVTHSIPVEFFDIYNYAVTHKCKWILIDREGDIMEELPQYQ